MRVPAHGNGALRVGGTNAGGTGRPPDRLRAELREIGLENGVPLIRKTIEGQVAVSLIGKCDACGHEQHFNEEWTELVMGRIKTTTDQQLKANEQALKFGLAPKELVITSQNAGAFFEVVHSAAVELFGDVGADALKARSIALMEQTK